MGRKFPATQRQEACESLCQPFLTLQAQIEKLRADLEGRKKIEKAKWILIKTKGINEDEAHTLLINHSRANRKKIVEMAEAIIVGERLLAQSQLLIAP